MPLLVSDLQGEIHRIEARIRGVKVELMGLQPIPMVAPRRSKNPAEWPTHYVDELERRRRWRWVPFRRRDAYEACLRLIEWREHDLGYAVYVEPEPEPELKPPPKRADARASAVPPTWVTGAIGPSGAVGVTGATGPPRYTAQPSGTVLAAHYATGPTGPAVYPTPILVAGAGGGAAGPVGVLKPPAVEVVDLVGMDGHRLSVRPPATASPFREPPLEER